MEKTQSSHNKSFIRAELLQIRKALPAEARAQWDQEICHHIQAFLQSYPCAQGFGFLSFPGEPDLRSLMGTRVSSLQRWGVPKVEAEGLCFYSWTPHTPLEKNGFGFWQPQAGSEPLSPEATTLILVPAVGLDRKGHRVGFGKGHYDRFLAQLDPKTCITMGVVYDACLREALPQDPWDIPLQYICTQAGWRAT